MITMLFIVSGLFAQEKKDTSTIFIGKTKIIIISDKDDVKFEDKDTTVTVELEDSAECKKDSRFNGRWAGVELGLNGYLNNNSLKLNTTDKYLSLNQSKSWNVSVNFAEFNIGIVKNYIGITSGLGLKFNNYRFENNIDLISDSAKITSFTDTVNTYRKNKLIATYLTLPLLVEFQLPVSKNGDRIHFTTGLVGGLRIGTHTKQVFDINGNENKDKQREDFHLSTFEYGLTARLSYNQLGVYVNYSLSTLFKDGEGPALNPWAAGLSFSF